MTTSPHVVVGVDGSECAKRALLWAVDYVRLTHGRMTVVTAWHYLPVGAGPTVMAIPSYDAEGTAREILEREIGAVDTSDIGRVERVVAEGAAASVLIENSRDADLLVVGSRGHGGFTGLLLGSVSAQCAHHAHCPVVIVRGDR